MWQLLKRLVVEDAGQDLVEYALLIGGIAVVVIPTAPVLATALDGAYRRISGRVDSLAP